MGRHSTDARNRYPQFRSQHSRTPSLDIICLPTPGFPFHWGKEIEITRNEFRRRWRVEKAGEANAKLLRAAFWGRRAHGLCRTTHAQPRRCRVIEGRYHRNVQYSGVNNHSQRRRIPQRHHHGARARRGDVLDFGAKEEPQSPSYCTFFLRFLLSFLDLLAYRQK
jgi:hypothetical protein